MATQTKLDPKKKAAAIIIDMGVETAAKVYKYLRPEEIEQLTVEIASLDKLAPEEVETTLDGFTSSALPRSISPKAGLNYARNILHKVMGPIEAAKLIEKITQSLRTRVFDFLKKNPKHLLSFIQNEHPRLSR